MKKNKKEIIAICLMVIILLFGAPFLFNEISPYAGILIGIVSLYILVTNIFKTIKK